MEKQKQRESIFQLISPDSDLVQRHLDVLTEMVAIDSRSFSVNEFPGDRETPTDMKEILARAQEYLKNIGFEKIIINQPPAELEGATPILMAELHASPDKPTVLLYAHLDKQPYMDDQDFKKWGGVAPTQLRWNEDRSRAYGRGAADDLSGVVAVGMAVDALVRSVGADPQNIEETRDKLPCNLKVIYETEEESGSISLIDQILQNREFFEDCDCVIITDVINPDTGVPGLTTSLRGILQLDVTLQKEERASLLSEQAALYRVLSTLIHDDHSLAVEGIAGNDIPVTAREREGYAKIPTTLAKQRDAGGLLPETRLTVTDTTVAIFERQLRQSYANVRPGHRVSGGVVFGSAGARLLFPLKPEGDRKKLEQALLDHLKQCNPFHLNIVLEEVESSNDSVSFDVLFHSANKDPHSGVVGGPIPVAELQLARWVADLIAPDGGLTIVAGQSEVAPGRMIEVQSLHVEHDGTRRRFENSSARAMVEIRLAPGNKEEDAARDLRAHLSAQIPAGFKMLFEADKGGAPWMTEIDAPIFQLMLECLEDGFQHPSCLYGCGGSIPFVAKLMDALGDIPPLCIGAYDPVCQMHEPGESLSMVDLLGAARSITHFFMRITELSFSVRKA